MSEPTEGWRRPDEATGGGPPDEPDRSNEVFGLVLAQHRGRLEAIARSILRDAAAAEDAVSEAAVRVWRRTRLEPPEHLLAYLAQAVRNEACSQLRRSERERVAMHLLGAALEAPGPEGRVEARDEVERLLAGLPPMQRSTLRLRYQHDRTEAEIADVLGIARGTVKGYAHRGLRRLREQAIAA